GFACLAVVAEGLSLLTLLGSTTAWIVAATTCGVVCGALPWACWASARAWQCHAPRRPAPHDRGGPSPWPAQDLLAREWLARIQQPDRMAALGRAVAGLLVLAVALHLAAAFILTWFAGINVGDSLTHYMPRSVRFVQYGTFG